MSFPFKIAVPGSIEKLIDEKKLLFVDQQEHVQSFGNAVVSFTSKVFDLRIVRDRGVLSIEISQVGKGAWHNLENVLMFLKEPLSINTIDELSKVLYAKFTKISKLMEENLAEVGLIAFEEDQARLLFPKLFPPSH